MSNENENGNENAPILLSLWPRLPSGLTSPFPACAGCWPGLILPRVCSKWNAERKQE